MDTDTPHLDPCPSLSQLSLNTHQRVSRNHGPTMAITGVPGQRHPAFSSESPARDFVFFALLPPELQTKIWSFAIAADVKVIEMKHQDYYHFNKFELVAKEQYEANMKRY